VVKSGGCIVFVISGERTGLPFGILMPLARAVALKAGRRLGNAICRLVGVEIPRTGSQKLPMDVLTIMYTKMQPSGAFFPSFEENIKGILRNLEFMYT
jgi:hypothetical protein